MFSRETWRLGFRFWSHGSSCGEWCVARRIVRRRTMLDVIYIAITVGFFLLAIAYVSACEKLR